jgi:pimeloyl-ACP methyl ester carboxylesterase
MPYAVITDLEMYYEELGSTEAPPLVLLHGAGGTADDPEGGWANLAPCFAERFRVFLIEHRGHGRTDNPAGFMTFEQIADDVAAFAEQNGLGAVHLAGISDGGIVALDCGIRRPSLTRTIVVVGGNHSVHDGITSYAASLDPEALESSHPEIAAEQSARHDQGKPAGYWKELMRQIVANNVANPSWTEADLGRIRCPALLIAGENDRFATLEQMVTMKRSIPNAEWLIVNNSGHPVHYEFPEIVGPRILDFLSRHS